MRWGGRPTEKSTKVTVALFRSRSKRYRRTFEAKERRFGETSKLGGAILQINKASSKVRAKA